MMTSEMESSSNSTEVTSYFETHSLEDLYQDIKNLYLEDDRPWVVGFSGGKDSTATLQLIWYAISSFPKNKRKKMIYVVSSDTLVESPPISAYLQRTIKNINNAARKQGLPIQAEIVYPETSETFWVNLIGKGYPAPQTKFRWCTDRMKIRPTNRFIMDKISKHGEVIIVLGVRKSESMTRAQVMKLRKIKNSKLRRHAHFPRAFVYTPIEDFTTDDVWSYLLQVPNPWGSDNQELLSLYKSSQGGECPLVIDTYTPSCGNSRFGCWTCTVVTRDKSLESFVENTTDSDWMLPMVDIRNILAETQDPENKELYRDFTRRDGRVYFNRSDSSKHVPGPYKFEFRKYILRKVLEAQEHARKHGPDSNIVLIREDELHEIRRIWRTEEADWEDSVVRIYREVTGRDLDWIVDDEPQFTAEEKELLEEICQKHDVPFKLVATLIDIEKELEGKRRRSAILTRIDQTFKKEWRPKEEVLKHKKMQEEFIESIFSHSNQIIKLPLKNDVVGIDDDF